VAGASCDPGPSPTARALRLEGLRAEGPDALRALLERVGEPPWDAEVADDDPVRPLLAAEGFEPYARVAVMARPLDGLKPAPHVPGVTVEPYRNAWSEAFQNAERMALEGLSTFAEMGQPTGYEQAEGFDAFAVARDRRDMLGFAQAMLPEGWINWMGVVPDARRQGIGRLLVAEIARQVRDRRGTHLAALVEVDTPGQPFLAALGFRERGQRRTLMIRRAG
jgi:GNAT superfamily N-acetyltransferase